MNVGETGIKDKERILTDNLIPVDDSYPVLNSLEEL